jgi:hypothetical protein
MSFMVIDTVSRESAVGNRQWKLAVRLTFYLLPHLPCALYLVSCALSLRPIVLEF